MIFAVSFCTDFYCYNLLDFSEHVCSPAESATFACTLRILLWLVSSAFDVYTSVFAQVSTRTAKYASWWQST